MKKNIIIFLFGLTVISAVSCSRSITPYEAANGKARCGRAIR